ncbi:hypothetical protein AB1Y20_009617 [Prymnesium parvum]|uniref:Cytochrome P450 n=1 Tax=Prymnesium parvum TaxID=97485 RepID=A0AB34K2J4_PRYPA
MGGSSPPLARLPRLPLLTLLAHGDFARTVAHCASRGLPIATATLPGGRALFFVSRPALAFDFTSAQPGVFSAREDHAAAAPGVVRAAGEAWHARRARLQPLQAPSALEEIVAPAARAHLAALPRAALRLPPPALLATCRGFARRVMHELLFSAQPATPPPLPPPAAARGARRRAAWRRVARGALAVAQLRALLRARRGSFFELAGAFTNAPRKVQRLAASIAARLPRRVSGGGAAAAAAAAAEGGGAPSEEEWVKAQVLLRCGEGAADGAGRRRRDDVLQWLLGEATPPSEAVAYALPIVSDLLAAGAETTAAAIASAALLLAGDEEKRAIAAEEAGRFLSEGDMETLDVRKALTSLRYCRACVMEALRLYPPAPLVMRVANSDTTLHGVDIPKGSAVITSPETLGRDPESWERPNEFLPNRFLDGPAAPPGAYIPFGAGPRACVGQQAALLISTLAIAHLFASSSDDEQSSDDDAEPDESI